MERLSALGLAILLGGCGGADPEPVEARYSVSRAVADAGDVELYLLRDAEEGVEVAVAPSVGAELAGLAVRVGVHS